MARPNWEYIRVDVLLPSHPKLAGGNLALIGLLVTIWCYSGQYLTDGFIPEAQWKRFGNARQREQLIKRGFAEPVDNGYQMHDYLGHQRSRTEAQELSAKRRQAGSRGGQAKANGVALAKQMVEDLVPLATASKASKALAYARVPAEAEAEAETDTSAEVVTTSVEGNQPGRIALPTDRWMADDEPEPLPPERLRLEAERKRQMDALMEWERQHPEAAVQ